MSLLDLIDQRRTKAHESYEERRRTTRVRLEERVFIETIDASQVTSINSDFKTAKTLDISAYGLQVMMDFEVPVDTPIALWITSEQHQKVLINGEVRWTAQTPEPNRFIVGIEVDSQSAESMREWCDTR